MKAEFDPLQHLVRPDQPQEPEASRAISSRQAPILLNQQAPARKSTLPTLRELRDLDRPVSRRRPAAQQLSLQASGHASTEQSRQNDPHDADATGHDDDITVATVQSEAETVVHKNTRPSRKAARAVLPTTNEEFDGQGLVPIEMIPEDESDEEENHHEDKNTKRRDTAQSEYAIAFNPSDNDSTCALGGTRERDANGSATKNTQRANQNEQEVNDEALARKLFQQSVEEAIINTHIRHRTTDLPQPLSPPAAAHVDADEALARRIFANDIAQARRATKDTLDEKLVVEEPDAAPEITIPTDEKREISSPSCVDAEDSSRRIRTGGTSTTTCSINQGKKIGEMKTKGKSEVKEGSRCVLDAGASEGGNVTSKPSMNRGNSVRPRNMPSKGPNKQVQAKAQRFPSGTTTTETSTTSGRSSLSSSEGSSAGNHLPSGNRSVISRHNAGRSVRSVATGKPSTGNAPRRSQRFPPGGGSAGSRQSHQVGRSSQDNVRSKSLDLATDKKRKGIFEKFLHLGGAGSDCGSASPRSDDRCIQRVDEGSISRPPLLEGSGAQSTVSSSANRRNVRGNGQMGEEKSTASHNNSVANRRRGRSSSHDDILSLDPMTDSIPITNLSRRTSRTNSSDNLSLNSDLPAHSALQQQHSGPRRRCVGCNRMESHRISFVELGDSKKRCACSSCCRTAQVDSEEASRLWSCVLDFFEKDLRLPVWDEMREITVALVSIDTMEEQMKNRLTLCSHSSFPNMLTQGLCLTAENSGWRIKETCLVFDRASRSFIERDAGHSFIVPDASKDDPYSSVTGILCVCGLPRELTISILAHEATHAWFRLHPDTDILKPMPPSVEEGCCQLIAYLLLEALDKAEEAGRDSLLGSVSRNKQLRQQLKLRIESDESDIFGQGYRVAAQACSGVGIDVLMGNVAMYRDIIR